MHTDGISILVSCVLGWFGRAYTSSYVIDEALTLTKAKMSGRDAIKLSESIIESKKITKLNVDDEETIFQDALARFKAHTDVKWLSFTDCTTLSLAKRWKIGTLLSFDGGFKPFVPVLNGESYFHSLSRDRLDLLKKLAQRIGIELN